MKTDESQQQNRKGDVQDPPRVQQSFESTVKMDLDVQVSETQRLGTELPIGALVEKRRPHGGDGPREQPRFAGTPQQQTRAGRSERGRPQ